ncbi:hypothetical protein Tco_1376115 [Tanacetum coccineum]
MCRLEEHKRMEALFLKTLQEEISNGKRTQRSSAFLAYYWGNTFDMAEKDRPLNSLNDQDMNLFLKDVTPWVEDLSRYNRATDKVHLTYAFDIFLGRQGPLRCRFPWCKDVSVDRRFWEILVCLDPTNKGWIMDKHVELWVNYMWHFRPRDADWAMVGVYFVQLLLQDSILSWYADGTLYKVSWCDVEEVLEVNGHAVTSYRMIVSVPTPYSSRLLGLNIDEEPIIEVDEIEYQMDTTLQVYNQIHEQFQNLGVEANSGSFFVGSFKETLILSNETDRSFHPCVAKIPEVMMQAKVFDQKRIDHTSYTISFTNAVNVPKQGGVFGDCGDVVLRTSCRPYSYGKTYYACPCSKPGTDDRGCGYFMWMDDFMNRISSSCTSTPPTLYTRPSTRPTYSVGTSKSAINVGKAECSNCKFLAEKIKTLEAKIKILEGTLEMERHPENHTIESAAILHELYNDMGKLGLE